MGKPSKVDSGGNDMFYMNWGWTELLASGGGAVPYAFFCY